MCGPATSRGWGTDFVNHKNAGGSLKRCKWFTKSISQRPAVIAQIQPARKLADPSCPAELDYHGHGLTGPTRYPSFIAAQALQPLRLLARDRANHLLMPAAAASSVVAEENSFALQGKILVLAPLRHRLILVMASKLMCPGLPVSDPGAKW